MYEWMGEPHLKVELPGGSKTVPTVGANGVRG